MTVRTRSRAVRRPGAAALGRVVLLCGVLALTACGGRQAMPEPGGKLLASGSPVAGEEGTVDLRVYLRAGEHDQAHLQAVTRRTAISGDLPRRALELLLAGPAPEDGKDLRAPLPLGTAVQSFAVEGDTAVVDLSAQAITDAVLVDPTAEHELLALAAVANTLTEFPAIAHVRLTVDGAGREFWGGWGLPEVLSRDEEVIGAPREGDPLPRLERFTAEPQRVGSADAGPVTIAGVRTLDRVGFLRLVIELADTDAATPASGVPAVSARLEGDRLLVEVDDVLAGAADLPPGGRMALEHLPFLAVEAEAGELPGTARYALVPGARPFWLHTLTSPTRVVIDVRK